MSVSQDTGDVNLYQPTIDTLKQTLTAAAIPPDIELALADAGYWSEANATSPGPDRPIATLKDHKQRRAARDLGQTSGPPPPDATPVEEMEHLLRTPQGARRLRQALLPDRADLRRPQAQPRDPRLPPPRPLRCQKRMGVHPPRRQHAQAPPPAPRPRLGRRLNHPSNSRPPAQPRITAGAHARSPNTLSPPISPHPQPTPSPRPHENQPTTVLRQPAERENVAFPRPTATSATFSTVWVVNVAPTPTNRPNATFPPPTRPSPTPSMPQLTSATSNAEDPTRRRPAADKMSTRDAVRPMLASG
jgi:hypothetical protein